MTQSARDDFAPYALDPFGPSANPAAYVACESSERARRILQAALDAGRAAAVVGPPGHGKTLLLHLIGAREQVTRARVAYVPFPSLAEDELFAMILEGLGARAEGDPRGALRQLVAELAPRGGVTLMIDDAHELQPAAARALAEEVAAAQGALRLLFAAVDGDRAYKVFPFFGKGIEVVSLDGSLSESETRRYVETRLAYAGARPDLVSAFDDETLAELHRDSHGVPRALNQAAQRVVRRAAPGNLPRLREILARRAPEEEEEEAHVPHVSLASLAERVLAGETPPQTRRRPLAAAADPARPPAIAPAPRRASAVTTSLVAPRTAASDSVGAGAYRMAREREAAAGRAKGGSGERRDTVFIEGNPLGLGEPGAALDPGSAPGFERIAGRGSLWSRDTAVSVFKWMAFGVGVGVAVMWWAGREAGDFSGAVRGSPSPALAPEGTGLVPAAEITRRGLPETEPGHDVPASEFLAPQAGRESAQPDAAEPLREVPLGAAAEGEKIAISINATPWARIEIDGEDVGETPLAGVLLTPGRHRFRATLPDGSVREADIEISSDRRALTFE